MKKLLTRNIGEKNMIAGLFLRHYKIYQGLYFIPISNDYSNKYSIFVGNNGVGKSSVLEALNTFFNSGYWNRNKGGKKDEAFIAPIFLIEKESLKEKVTDVDHIRLIEFVSDYFWDATPEINPNLNSEEFSAFFQLRDGLTERYSKEEYYFFIIGIEYENKNEIFFTTFHRDIKGKIPLDLQGYDYNKLLELIREYYSYIYIPIEAAPKDVLRIENREMQELMDRDILNEIDTILNQKIFTEGNRTLSAIGFINNSLNKYIDSINNIIGMINEEYAFKVEGAYKKNLTSTDVRKKILEAYFSIRTLKKDKKEINELSSGEQRIALIDMASAFLLESKRTTKKIILAIDEPENSLHITKAFSQFERLQKLSNDNQIILTTHWYGSLPITNEGNLHHLEKNERRKIKVSSFNLNNYFEKRGSLPHDIAIKSYFELTSSILSSMRADNTNWIICEGSDDKLYLEYYLKDIDNLKIFTVGGIGNVVKLYKYLYIPFSEKEEYKNINGKILCLVDTDEVIVSVDFPSSSHNLKIARMQIDNKDEVELINLRKNGANIPTDIEDCLHPQTLYNAITKAIVQYGTDEQKAALESFVFKEDSIVSRVKGEKSIFKPVNIDAFMHKEYIYNFINNYRNKYLIAEAYLEELEGKEIQTPVLFNLIKDYFNKDKEEVLGLENGGSIDKDSKELSKV